MTQGTSYDPKNPHKQAQNFTSRCCWPKGVNVYYQVIMTMEIQHPFFLVEADTILYGVHVTCFYTPLLCALTPHSLPEYTYHLPRTRK